MHLASEALSRNNVIPPHTGSEARTSERNGNGWFNEKWTQFQYTYLFLSYELLQQSRRVRISNWAYFIVEIKKLF